ncbi:MAG: 16S rRNA (guanine(966)-N(2))-methyltransferase RsmD [Desulfotignum sp.]|jgi:16S rRNA (guanine966-N2)-methyltransferase|nr:16S rRNA (guanine(966)-N(2))-methyltransferase RsmD [Desulfotignum sp.]
MRIISGTCRGRKLFSPKGLDIRPTSDRIKESVFNILGPRVKKALVLDLFAGTGALGLEALSRGAACAVFVDKSAASCRIIQQNIDHCRFPLQSRVLGLDIFSQPLPLSVTTCSFDLVFMDPPYHKNHVRTLLENHQISSFLSDDGIVVAEHAAKETLPDHLNGLDIFRQKKYSGTTVSFLTRTQDPA